MTFFINTKESDASSVIDLLQELPIQKRPQGEHEITVNVFKNIMRHVVCYSIGPTVITAK